MPKKLVKQIAEEVFGLPKGVATEAARQVGILPQEKKEQPKGGISQKQLAQKKQQDKVWAEKRIREIEAEIQKIIQKRRLRKAQEEAQKEKAESEEEEKMPPLVEVPTKRKRGLFASFKFRKSKSITRELGSGVSG